ncbi:hypothetical protein ACLKA6_000511 [Drosophila palustris]
MAALNFVFDIFVKSFESPKLKAEDAKKLQVEAQFNGKKIAITSSRINVDDFNPNASTDFRDKDKRVRENVESCGLTFAVKFNNRAFGNGRVNLPEKFIDGIKEGMSDLVHEDSCSIENKDKEEVGKLTFKCRLIIKCDGPDESECRRNMDASINPEDIMFVLAESQKCPPSCDPCLDVLDPEEGDERLQLDLMRYRSAGPGVPSNVPDTLKSNSAGDPITSELKKMAKECEETIDLILNGADPAKQPMQQLLQEMDSFLQNSGEAKEKPINSDDDKENVDDNIPGIKPIRYCPICLNNMSWLPKFACCPKCGAKPTPLVEERLKEQLPTAEEILNEYLGKPQRTVDEICLEDAENPKASEFQSRCTCKRGKRCAHCRVREQVKDVFQIEGESRRVSRGSKAGQESAEPKPGEPKTDEPKPGEPKPGSDPASGHNTPPSVGSEDFPGEVTDERDTHLARVFSELCFLYRIRVSNSTTDMQKICANKKGKKTDDPKEKGQSNEQKGGTSKSEGKSASAENDQKRKSKSGATDVEKRKSSASNASGSPRNKREGKPPVPAKLGWDFRTDPAYKKGWRPGAVSKPIKRIMDFFLRDGPEVNASRIMQSTEAQQKAKERSEQSMLNVCKKNGEICITLRSMDPNNEKEPIVYKVTRSDQAVRLSEMKRKLKEDGFRKCSCHKSLMLCVCRSVVEKKQLEAALEAECTARGIPSCPDELILTDTSESDLEYDFNVSPLMGAPKPPQDTGPCAKWMNKATQTAEEDSKVKPKYPVEQSPYYKPFDCATRSVYNTGPMSYDDEEIYEEDGSPGKGGNGGGNRGSPGRGNGAGNRGTPGRGNFGGGNPGRGNPGGGNPGRGNPGGGNPGRGSPGSGNPYNEFVIQANQSGRGNGNNNGNPRRGNGNNAGNNKGRGMGNSNANNGARSNGGGGKTNANDNDNSNASPVALPKRLQKNKAADAAKAAEEEKKKEQEEKQKKLKKHFMALAKAPPIDRQKTLRILLHSMPPPVEAIPRLGRATAALDDCYIPCDPCCNPCYTDCCCPRYFYCC